MHTVIVPIVAAADDKVASLKCPEPGCRMAPFSHPSQQADHSLMCYCGHEVRARCTVCQKAYQTAAGMRSHAARYASPDNALTLVGHVASDSEGSEPDGDTGSDSD